jgi:hypothetical protein
MGVPHSTFFSARGVVNLTIESLDAAFSIGFPADDVAKFGQW